MATGAEYVDIQQKRVLGLADLDDRFFQYLQDADRELATRLYSLPGVFTAVTFGIAVADEFDLSPTSFFAEDGLGHLLEIPVAESQNVPFPNAVATTYYIALTYAVSPVEVQTNPRTGLKFYTGWEERVGYSDVPTGVVDNGTDLTFDLSTLLDPAEDHTGREVLVWLNDPETGTFSEAVETCLVAYSGGVSKITTSGLLGQSSPSTTAADYTVMLVGPRVSAATDYSLSANHVYLGTVTGGGPGVVPAGSSTVGQRVYWDGGISDLSNVLETGPNGDTKIAVKAHVADVGVRQISVIDSAGLQQFEVDEGGNIEMGDGVATNPTLKLVPPAGTVPTQDRNGNNWRISADRLDFAGVNGLHLSGGSGGKDKIESAQTLELKDATTDTDLGASDANVDTTWARENAIVDTVNDVTQRIDITVGLSAVGPTAFAKLTTALAFIAAQPAGRKYRIVVLNEISEAAADLPIDFSLSANFEGLVIEGAGDGARILWDGDVPLFDLHGMDSLTFRHLNLIHNETSIAYGPPASPLTTRVAWTNILGGGAVSDLVIEDCRVGSAAGSTGIHGAILDFVGFERASVRNLRAEVGDFGIVLKDEYDGHYEQVLIEQAAHGPSALGTYYDGIWIEAAHSVAFSKCRIDGLSGNGMVAGGGSAPLTVYDLVLEGCKITGTSGWSFLGDGCHYGRFIGNSFYAPAGMAAVYLRGLAVANTYNTFSGNVFKDSGTGTLSVWHGVDATPSTYTCIIGNNLGGLATSPAGITDTVTPNNP